MLNTSIVPNACCDVQLADAAVVKLRTCTAGQGPPRGYETTRLLTCLGASPATVTLLLYVSPAVVLRWVFQLIFKLSGSRLPNTAAFSLPSCNA